MSLKHFDLSSSENHPSTASQTRVAFLSTYPPRACGLASFCEDLVMATAIGGETGEPIVVAMENGSQARDYRPPVALVVKDTREDEYEEAAAFLNRSPADIVSVQHEFGIFGGPHGRGLCRFLDRLTKPVVITLHTVIPDPEPHLRSLLCYLAERSRRLVVMNPLAIDILCRDYRLDRDRIAFIHHGALPPSLESREDAKARLGLAGRKVLSTFGLVGRGKGLEYVLAALPRIRERHPNVCYLIVGQTHPSVRRVEKESYREGLAGRVRDLRLRDSVRFVNRYIGKSEMVSYLAATDVYITPYLNPEQITSGTLAYAVGAGKAIVSTPYFYGRFLLDDGRGLLIDFRSETAVAAAVGRILDTRRLQRALEARTRAYGQQMFWPAVGAHYRTLFEQVLREHRARAVPRSYAQLQLSLPIPMPEEPHDEFRTERPTALAPPPAAAD